MTASESHPKRNWQPLAFGVIIAAFLIVGVLMRLHQLGLPFDRDGYDEGVFWQTLLAMAEGKQLYSDIYCSQPPAFLLTIYPIFILFGKTIWSARLGIVIISMLGLVGVALLGHALAGRAGAIAGMMLLLASPMYLMQSQTVQGEAPSIAFSFVAVGLAYHWWETHDEKLAYIYSILSAAALCLSIYVKLVGICTLVPIIIIAVMKVGISKHGFKGKAINSWEVRSLIIGGFTFLLVGFFFSLPIIGSWHQYWLSAIMMYTTAQDVFQSSQPNNLVLIEKVLFGPLGITALCGLILTVRSIDSRVYPLIAWLSAVLWMLWSKVPLFSHHLLALLPPLIALAVFGMIGIFYQNRNIAVRFSLTKIIPCAILGIVVLIGGWHISEYYRNDKVRGLIQNEVNSLVVSDLQAQSLPDQLIITDAPFLAALAKRRTPAALVDTSMVRIKTGFVTSQQLIREAVKPNVVAVLFYSGRFNLNDTIKFHPWISKHFRYVTSYHSGQELWIK